MVRKVQEGVCSRRNGAVSREPHALEKLQSGSALKARATCGDGGTLQLGWMQNSSICSLDFAEEALPSLDDGMETGFRHHGHLSRSSLTSADVKCPNYVQPFVSSDRRSAAAFCCVIWQEVSAQAHTNLKGRTDGSVRRSCCFRCFLHRCSSARHSVPAAGGLSVNTA